MAKRKKKQSEHTKLKLAEAHRRNEFFYKLNYLIAAVTGDASVYRLIPEKELDHIFLIRLRALRIKADTGSNISSAFIADARLAIFRLLKRSTLQYTPGGPIITLDMFLTVGITLYTYLSILKDLDFPAAKKLKSALAAVTLETENEDRTDVMGTLFAQMDILDNIIPFIQNDFKEAIYWVEDELVTEGYVLPLTYYQLTIRCEKPDRMNFVIDGNSRPAYRLSWGTTENGIIKLSADPVKLGLSSEMYPEQLPVYVQAHALNRLYERIDCVLQTEIPVSIFMSLADCEYCTGRGKTYLIKYNLQHKKAGYFVADIHQGVLLVHTFLFLTNNGTPEGDRLLANTGLGKLDKAYLNIDKLSTFYKSDIAENPAIKQIFVKAGCGELFELGNITISSAEQDAKIPLAEKIRAYLSYANIDDNLETYEKEQLPESAE